MQTAAMAFGQPRASHVLFFFCPPRELLECVLHDGFEGVVVDVLVHVEVTEVIEGS